MRAGLALTGAVFGVAGIVLACLPDRLELEVGVHRIAVTRPAGFELVPDDDGFLLQNGAVFVELVDLGAPGGPPGPEAPLDEWVEWGLRWLDPPRQRGVARSGSLLVQGRELRVVETWDSLSHDQRRRFAFVRNEGALLALHTGGGDHGRATAAFESVLRTFEFLDP